MSPVVYRIYDKDGVLLYIGSTVDLCQRIRGHFGSRWSCSENAALRERFDTVFGEPFPTLAEARAAEKQAIREEGPLLNKEHNPKRWRKVPRNQWVPVESELVSA
jgi:predicted GIY-YIG superfamily endonuclease